MEQKRRRSSGRTGSGNVSPNRNVRSISNSREVSRRSKGKNRYAYEEDRRAASRYYDDDDYYSSSRKKQPKAVKSQKRKAADMKKASRTSRRQAKEDACRSSARRRGRKKNGVSKALGVLLCILQFVISVILVVNVLFFNILTETYILVLVGILTILFGITLLSQLGARGKGIAGKVFSIFLCVIMGLGSFYIGEVNNAFQNITGNNTETNSMVVAVLKDDGAESINDASNYNFGVQYTTGADQMTSAINQIEKETGNSITTTEYNSMAEEVQALYDGEVEAIIYNSGYVTALADQYSTFSDDVRIIYQHDIVVSLDGDTADASMSEPFAVYLSGIDQWDDSQEEDTGRSDVNIIAVVNPDSHQILLVSTPRDYYVTIPGISNGQYDKLTHAGIYGVDVSMATLSALYETDINFFGRVNFSTMVRIVDALGGIDVISDEEFDTGPETGVDLHVNEGENHFNGEQALAFCRERHAVSDGDNARGRHQQAVITAIIQKMMSPAMLRGATEIISSVSDGVETNFTDSQIQTLIKTQLRTGASWNIYSVSAEGYGDMATCFSSGSTELSVIVPDDTSVANIIDLINRVEAGEVLEDSTVAED